MKSIGGNVIGEFQTKTTTENAIGEKTNAWTTSCSSVGFLDYSSGQSDYRTYDAKVQESTHIFICDYFIMVGKPQRMIVNGKVYDILLIDNPMELNEQLEIYLKYVGEMQ